MTASRECHATSAVQMLFYGRDSQQALPRLTEMGNGLALIINLDVMLGTHSDGVSMQLAPLLGITPTPAGHMQSLVSALASPGHMQGLVSVLASAGHMQGLVRALALAGRMQCWMRSLV